LRRALAKTSLTSSQPIKKKKKKERKKEKAVHGGMNLFPARRESYITRRTVVQASQGINTRPYSKTN
jgi:hypothetical protein